MTEEDDSWVQGAEAPPNVLVVFYSRDGSLERLALAVAEGAAAVGAEVRLRRARERVDAETMGRVPGWRERAERMNALYDAPTIEDAEWADALVFGAPSRFGSASSEIRAYLESLGALWVSGQLMNKVGSAFTSASALHGGVEATILGLYPTLAHLNLVIVPTGYGHVGLSRSGTPYGAASISYAAERRPPSDLDLEVARYQGQRVARVAHALRTLRHSPNFDT